ncbi:HD domain-containing protein [Demequina sp. NBRC 110054]|uniref:[protein-PII] uridylyltransferase family protein n=1 Tax=Demequina sp. NBRC 110054 TaxID=1570343 RepID=UPI000A062382|nr:HD domain-containing protein [Demequina sp. NBRC 110054]
MPSRDGQFREGSDAEVPHPEGVRDLKRLRRELADTLYRDGAPGKYRRQALTDLTIAALSAHWDEAADGLTEGIALGAVGSLGRGDSGPYSDLDVVLIHDGRTLKSDEVAELAQRLWYPIWDAGLELDYSSRSLTEVRQVASKDLAAASGLLDLKPVAGDKELAQRARSLIYQDWRAAARKRLPELFAASKARAERHGELAYLIEPNLKEARGGLRDLVSLTGLSATWLTDRPHGAVDEAGAHVMDVRDAIQMEVGRPQNVLGRHLADEVAALMGHDDPDDLLASLAEAGREISYALDMTERGARRSLERSGVGSRAFLARRRARAPRHTVVATGLIDVDGELALAPSYDATSDALLPLRAAATAASTGLTITPTLLATLQRCPALPDPWPEEAREHLRELLRGSAHLIAVWEAIDLAGLIVRGLPEWQGVRNRPQRSPIHRFTVDRHMVESVVLAAKMRKYDIDHDLLRFALLVHDIGKRPGATDHSIDGAVLIPEMGRRLGLSPQTIHDVELLVRQHLTLANLATTEDPEDPATIERLLDAVEHRVELLDTLRALTECDARAAGPKAWTQWREQLVNTLYTRARAVAVGRGEVGGA